MKLKNCEKDHTFINYKSDKCPICRLKEQHKEEVKQLRQQMYYLREALEIFKKGKKIIGE